MAPSIPETMGLRLGRDPLCVVQLSAGNGDAHLVQLDRSAYDAPNLKRLLADPTVLKIFHFGRFDIAMFPLHLGVVTAPVYCTKIASKLARTYTDRHGLKDVSARAARDRDVQGPAELGLGRGGAHRRRSMAYAASDVLHLHALQAPGSTPCWSARRPRRTWPSACFDFLPHRARLLDVAGWEDVDIFAHSLTRGRGGAISAGAARPGPSSVSAGRWRRALAP